MSGRVHAEAKAASKTSFVPVQTGLLAGSRGKLLVSQPPLVQAKLTINQPNDRYEQEADRVAEQVLRMPEPRLQQQVEPDGKEEETLQTKPLSAQITPLIQRQIEPEEEEEEELIQAKETSGQTPHVSPIVQTQIHSLRGGGQRLSPSLRNFFEPRFGHDFSRVRVHTDAHATESARALKARAFTVGQDVVFGVGEFTPSTARGRRLVAHELTHTIQQSGKRQQYIQRYATCGSQDECPRRVHGELSRARRNPMLVRSVTGSVRGLLVANFAVGSASLRPHLQSNPAWANFWGQMVTNTNIRWEILGFSDCRGSEGINELLRWQRAIAVNNALPQLARNQVDEFRAMPMSDCIAENTDERGRTLNRSALIRQKSTTYQFEEEEIRVTPYAACYDGTTVFASKNGGRHRCHALTGNIGAPTPDGIYCIRRQGVAQRTTFYRDRSGWYLLEPQFTTTRSRIQLHPGSFSAGCITVTDSDCFDQLAVVLNSSGTVTGTGYDGYPPDNAHKVKNPRRTVTCVGWLLVRRRRDGCAIMSTPSSP